MAATGEPNFPELQFFRLGDGFRGRFDFLAFRLNLILTTHYIEKGVADAILSSYRLRLLAVSIATIDIGVAIQHFAVRSAIFSQNVMFLHNRSSIPFFRMHFSYWTVFITFHRFPLVSVDVIESDHTHIAHHVPHKSPIWELCPENVRRKFKNRYFKTTNVMTLYYYLLRYHFWTKKHVIWV